MLNLNELPREIRDKIELREQMDSTFYRFVEEEYTEEFFNIVNERSDMSKESSLILSVYGSQGSGKSWSAIAVASMLDPEFSVDKIFFSYNDIVHNRAKLKPNSAIILDEQTQSYGLDSHRVMLILNSIKEQLRKKSIHLIFCSPVLHEEAKTSMYLLEILFIDRETQEAVAAFKTREGHTLGHVMIPSPLKKIDGKNSLQSKAFMDLYEMKKDEHLEKLLGQKHVDVFEERAKAVCDSELFKQAEKVYVKKLGYIPRDRIVQIINKLFPEYHAGVVPQEIAERIRMNKELSGDWTLPGQKKKGKK